MVAQVVVVNNGSTVDITLLTQQAGYQKARVIRRASNEGSAAGFHEGLAAVVGSDEFVLLLDDDNVPASGCLETLVAEYERLSSSEGPLALLAYRPSHQADIAAGVPLSRCFPRNDSFLGFHVVDVPYKIWRRLPFGKPPNRAASETLVVPVAPYGGMFFHASLLDRIGLPERDFVLYVNDIEFSYRITRAGGRIALVTPALIDDLEGSWNLKSKFKTTFDKWLSGPSDMRAYYGCRNQVYFENKFCVDSRRMYALNRSVYWTCLALRAHRLSATARLELLKRAVGDGLSGSLGISSHCPRPH